MSERRYKNFTHKEAVFRICCKYFDAVIGEIVDQRRILERYIRGCPEFQHALKPMVLSGDVPKVALRMANASQLADTGPMAAVAGVMAQLGAEAGLMAGADEAIVENGGDIYLATVEPIVIGLYPGKNELSGKLGFSIEPDDTPIAVCSSSGKMGHSMSMGICDLATVVAKDAGLADAAATQGANFVQSINDVDTALNRIVAIKGVDGVVIVKDGRIGLAGKLPDLIKIS